MNTESRPIKPPALRPGDTIGIFSPSEPLTKERKERLSRGIELLKSLDFKVELSGNIFKSKYYMAGKAQERVQDFHGLLMDKEVKAIMASWGGKSSNQLIELIDYALIRENPKIISGFSDTTNLINAIYAKTGLVTFHGPNVAGKIAESLGNTVNYMKKAFCTGRIGVIKSMRASHTIKPGRCEGRLIGGNLTCFDLGLVGTRYAPNFDGAIMFWESGSRTSQEIHQYITHLRLTGAFDKIVGMVVGFVDPPIGKAEWGNRPIDEVIIDATEGYDFPVLYLPAFGHGDVENVTLPIGCKTLVDTKDHHFEIIEECVEV